MNGTLKMDSEGLRALANKFNNKASSLDSLTTTFDTNCQNITAPDTWSGDDVAAFQQAANTFKNELSKASAFLKSVSKDFNDTASNFDDTEAGNKSRNQSLI